MRRIASSVLVILGILSILSLGGRPAAAAPLSPGDILVAGYSSNTVLQFSATGTDLGVFFNGPYRPNYLTTDGSGNIYVTGDYAQEVDKVSPSGALLQAFYTSFVTGGAQVAKDGTLLVGEIFGSNVYRYSATGTLLGLFDAGGRTDFMAQDANGNLYVGSPTGGNIRRFTSTGVSLGDFVSGFGEVEGIAFDASGNLFAADASRGIIEKFSPTGEDLGRFASGLNRPYGINFDANGNLYVANFGAGNIRMFSSSGSDLGVFASGLISPRDVLVYGAEVPPSSVPEPSTLLLLGSGLAGLGSIAWRQKHRG